MSSPSAIPSGSTSKRHRLSQFFKKVSQRLPTTPSLPPSPLVPKNGSLPTQEYIPTDPVNLDAEFLATCLAISQQAVEQSPSSPTDAIMPPTAFSFTKLPVLNKGERLATDNSDSNERRLTEKYPNAYHDFYGCGTPCIFKSGPEWPVSEDLEVQGVERESRPVYCHAITSTWLAIGERIYSRLDSDGVRWTSINPLAYANSGEAKPFCSLILCIGVMPYSLDYDAAVTAAAVVKEILTTAGFPTIEVAFVESVVTRSVTTGPKLLSFNPDDKEFMDLRKPFTPTLGLSIAPLKYPYLEGTAGLYFRLGKENKRMAILTCAHVARPPPTYRNTGMTYKHRSQPREEFIALGDMGYDNAVNTLMATIGVLYTSIEGWKTGLRKLGDPSEGEQREDSEAEMRKEYLALIDKATKKIEATNAFHNEVTKHYSSRAQRVIGFVLHSEKIEVSVEPHGFTKDWALIELYEEKIDWSTFKGNKVFIGGNLPIEDFGTIMFPQPVDRADFHYPKDGLLQAYGVVQHAEIQNPHHLDIHNERCLLVVKNGLTTGTTIGRANGLESFTRTYKEYGIKETSLEIAVSGYDKNRGKFSDGGDSGSIVLARDGRIVGILTGGAGPTDKTDISYLTPYWWLEEQIKAKYPDCFLYQVVE